MKTVLIVEDTEDLRELFMAVLRGNGYRVLGAENGREALDILSAEASDPCLVLLDMMMPIMDGKMFLNAVQRMHRVASLPVLVVSASVSENAMPGAARVVKKPVGPEELLALVHEYCGPP